MKNKINITKEHKELLFKDLCARLPHHVKVKVWLEDGTTEEGALDLEHNYANVLLDAFYYNKIKAIKPYLFPLSSMTEEQKKNMKMLLFITIILMVVGLWQKHLMMNMSYLIGL